MAVVAVMLNGTLLVRLRVPRLTRIAGRHASFLEYKLRSSPEFAPAIREARRRISNNPELSSLMAAAGQRLLEARQAEQEVIVPAHEQRHREFAPT